MDENLDHLAILPASMQSILPKTNVRSANAKRYGIVTAEGIRWTTCENA